MRSETLGDLVRAERLLEGLVERETSHECHPLPPRRRRDRLSTGTRLASGRIVPSDTFLPGLSRGRSRRPRAVRRPRSALDFTLRLEENMKPPTSHTVGLVAYASWKRLSPEQKSVVRNRISGATNVLRPLAVPARCRITDLPEMDPSNSTRAGPIAVSVEVLFRRHSAQRRSATDTRVGSRVGNSQVPTRIVQVASG